MTQGKVPHILVLGGGYVGMYTALGLQKKLRQGQARVTVVDPRSYMTYQPFLPEASAGALEPRHVVVPLRRVLRKCHVVTARVRSISHAEKKVSVEPEIGDPFDIDYDILVVALGAIARTLPIPGLADVGIGFKQVEEAIGLRNHVLDRLDIAASTTDEAVRRKALTFVFVGGGYAGAEALGELENMAQYALRYYPQISPRDMRWVLVDAADRILPEVGDEMGVYTVEELSKRGIEIRLKTFLESCVDGHVVLSKGKPFDADTIVWTAGVKANPVLADSDLPLDERGRVSASADMRVVGVDDAWAAGDNAAVPDLASDEPDATCAPNAQHAVRQAKLLAKNIVATLNGKEPKQYRHKYVGSVAGLGLYKGVAHVYGIKVKGFPAWFMHRSYHMSKMPTFNRKSRVIVDWTMALLFRREVVSLGRMRMPREEFRRAATPKP
ncbi:NAD(P)/FAD-dependent oxidoreductase [Phytoactinopolyspora alkaliphila]|uniref:NAD(P)/FAD-dependent oxidoreductase n=1 Tax=Phytoactinopolyspora alkaliphila TaxID=1783498 RepID=A0A6N9YJR8_9ACTN|nr:NAD(P)/FAD-dependent oxidoreductase [Phytoactinopolyspora alkaliphila]NED95202.1 NAD(P)/FAD-dependent oxidoreductase [Phytoactinopolyspora alkaliphila]